MKINNRFFLATFLIVMSNSASSITQEKIQNIVQAKESHPFSYNLGIKYIPSKQTDASVTICCHGYGHSNQIANVVHSFNVIPDHIIGFNFPDYDCIGRKLKVEQTVFGSIDEIVPLLYITKLCVIEGAMESINLYGFSAGGGAIINMVAILNQTTHDIALKKIGISADDKKKIMRAIEKGHIILDCPLKSMDEIIEMRSKDADVAILAQRYCDNNMRPIDAIKFLQGLKLNILVHFQTHDEMIGNRDDALFVDRLTASNKGKTEVIYGNDGGHNTYHASLWKQYKKFRSTIH